MYDLDAVMVLYIFIPNKRILYKNDCTKLLKWKNKKCKNLTVFKAIVVCLFFYQFDSKIAARSYEFHQTI